MNSDYNNQPDSNLHISWLSNGALVTGHGDDFVSYNHAYQKHQQVYRTI